MILHIAQARYKCLSCTVALTVNMNRLVHK